MDRQKVLRDLHIILRIFLLLANHAVCLPAYIVWMILLRPLLYYRPELYYYLEAWMYDSLQHLVAYWTWNVGYTGTCRISCSYLLQLTFLVVTKIASFPELSSLQGKN